MNGVTCNHCGVTIISGQRNDFKSCACTDLENRVFVDGDDVYVRRGAGRNASWVELSDQEKVGMSDDDMDILARTAKVISTFGPADRYARGVARALADAGLLRSEADVQRAGVSNVDRAVEVIRENTEGDPGAGCTVVHGVWRAAKALANAGLLRSEADVQRLDSGFFQRVTEDRAIADRVRGAKRELIEVVARDGYVLQRFVNLKQGDVEDVGELLTWLLNGGEG